MAVLRNARKTRARRARFRGTAARNLKTHDTLLSPVSGAGSLPTSTVGYQEAHMAKKRKRKYSRSAGKEVEREMHRYKRGKAKSGKGGKGGKVKSRKQAIAIALSKARKKGKKVPRKKK
jgi:hypothetical protein